MDRFPGHGLLNATRDVCIHSGFWGMAGLRVPVACVPDVWSSPRIDGIHLADDHLVIHQQLMRDIQRHYRYLHHGGSPHLMT